MENSNKLQPIQLVGVLRATWEAPGVGGGTMLWARKLTPVPGVSQEPVRPVNPSVTAYMARTRSLLNPKLSKYCLIGFRHRSTNICPQPQATPPYI